MDWITALPPEKRWNGHGMSRTPIYHSWQQMLARCLRPAHPKYRIYGARGIKVCERWAKFSAFFEDMGATYKDGFTIERINVNGNYEPSNCVWITKSEQSKNKRPWKPDLVDLTGQRFGNWTALRVAKENCPGRRWLCRCECGNEREILTWYLTGGKLLRCWSCSLGSRHVIDLAGKTFGLWTVLERQKGVSGQAKWVCRCVCGTERSVASQKLRLGRSKSCGCAIGRA